MSIAVPLYGFGASGGGYTGPKVIGSPTQPSDPKGNTVWVQTSTTISSWEMSEVATTPGWNEAPAGFVYIMVAASDWTAPNLVKFTKKNYGNVFLKAVSCWQNLGVPGTPKWTRMNAYIYHNDTWTQFSSVFSATINITYPAGSTCTCSDGTTTLSAPDTSGTWACIVPNAGTWTVKATDGTKQSTVSVAITTDGQTESVALVFELKLTSDYWNGDISSVSTSWSEGHKTTTCIFTKSKIDLTPYDTLSYKHTHFNGSSGATAHITTSTKTGNDSAPNDTVAQKWTGSDGTYIMDVSSLEGSYYLAFQFKSNYGSSGRDGISDVVLT